MNTMWIIIISGMILGAVFSVFFLWSRFCRFRIVKRLSGGRRWAVIIIGFVPVAILGFFAYLNLVNTVVIIVYLCVYWIVAEGLAAIVRTVRGKRNGQGEDDSKDQSAEGPYWTGIIVLCFAICYFSVGWYLAHHVRQTDYTVRTEKNLGTDSLKIAFFADSHIGALFDGKGFARRMEAIRSASPDILLIPGDFVDDATTKEDMIASCQALAGFDCPYGKYFVYGNHDTGNYGFRHFTVSDLVNELEKAGVVILEDEALLINDSFYLIGRKDRTVVDRMPLEDIMSKLDRSKYMIVMDHQPNDYQAEAKAGPDLVLSGHTHGGQMIEMKLVSELIKANDRTYGMEQRDNTVFLVTSGIADWAIKFKTGTESEYCIVNVVQEDH